MDATELQKLAELARISVSEDELRKLHTDMGAILRYISRIQEISDPHKSASTLRESVSLVNVMREDKEPHESGVYTDALLSGAPETQDGYIKVKKIIST